jgi:hypothetical protein
MKTVSKSTKVSMNDKNLRKKVVEYGIPKEPVFQQILRMTDKDVSAESWRKRFSLKTK